MLLSFQLKKIYTENPYADELVYYAKLLGMGTVLKMQQLADDNETAESLKRADLYIACMEKTVIFELFPSISASALKSAGVTDPMKISIYLRNRYAIPDTLRADVTEALRVEYIENYEDLNPYYRMLHGLPAIGREDYVTDWQPENGASVDITKPVHKMSASEISILEHFGVIDRMIDEDPVNREYMRHLNEKSIDYYTARRANRFDVLYIPEVDAAQSSIYKIYRDTLENNKFYTLRTVYSEAFKFNSTYYDNFIAIFIVLITVIDLISRIQEFITRKEIFDIRSVQYIFESNGVPFYAEIPLKYQIRMVKNLHKLLKYKSTKKCMVDICKLFGFDNIEIFKYYLTRSKPNAMSDPTDPTNYELEFLKLPLDGRLIDYAGNDANYLSYDEVTSSDPTWDGGLDHQDVYDAIREHEFNFSRTKYISITTIYDVAKVSIQQSYFFNFLYDNMSLEDLCTIRVPFIDNNANFNIADIFIFLNILAYIYHNTKDTIVDTQSKVLYVNGFNFKADLGALAQEIVNCDEATELLESFKLPQSQIPSFSEMVSIYVNNMGIRDKLVEGMINADNLHIYNIYKMLYDALMVTELTFDFYKNPETNDFYRDSEGDATYTEFLKHRNDILYNLLMRIQTFEDEDTRNQYICTVIDNIVWSLEEFVDSSVYRGLFANLPVNSIESIKNYIAKVINFYKSFKIQFLGFDTLYTFGDSGTEFIKVIEGINGMKVTFSNIDSILPFDMMNIANVDKTTDDVVGLQERLYFIYDNGTGSDDEPIEKPEVSMEISEDVVTFYDSSKSVIFIINDDIGSIEDPAGILTLDIDGDTLIVN